jgi:hypothetical protein
MPESFFEMKKTKEQHPAKEVLIMNQAYEERCILELTRIIRNQGQKCLSLAQVEAVQRYRDFEKEIDSKISDAISHDKDYFYIRNDLPRPLYMILLKMGYKMSEPYDARLNFDNETIKVCF